MTATKIIIVAFVVSIIAITGIGLKRTLAGYRTQEAQRMQEIANLLEE